MRTRRSTITRRKRREGERRRSTTRNIENYGEIAATTATEKNTGKRPRYAAKTEYYREKRPEIRENGLYEPKNASFRPIFRLFGLTGMKIRKNESVEQGVAPYGAQGAPPVNADVQCPGQYRYFTVK